MRLIEKVWFYDHPAKYWLVPLLFPLSVLFYLLSSFRRLAFRLGIFTSSKVNKPVVVVGNIGIGGNGKTPVVVYLVELAKQLGLKPGVISRGYGGQAEIYPYLLSELSTSEQAGDEPVLIFKRCQIPVVVGPNRAASAQHLIHQGCDIIISDDGLQHYHLQRDLEIIVIDGKRLFGNGLLLPAGPLREGLWRLPQADVCLYNGGKPGQTGQAPLMTLQADSVIHLKTGEKLALANFVVEHPKINALAGIGDPQRFFDTLQGLGFNLLKQQGFVDHKKFVLDDFSHFKNHLPLLMTEKDAVKCQTFAEDNWWYLPVDAHFSLQDKQMLQQKLQAIISKKSTK